MIYLRLTALRRISRRSRITLIDAWRHEPDVGTYNQNWNMKFHPFKSERVLINVGVVSAFIMVLGFETFTFPSLAWEYRFLGIAIGIFSVIVLVWSVKGSSKKNGGVSANTQLQDTPPSIIENVKNK